MPTPEQLESRKTLAEFVASVSGSIRQLGSKAKSEWFGRPDDELKGWIERGRAIEEIRDSLGYRLILTQTDNEILWAQQQLEVCDESALLELRMYLRALRFFKNFIVTTEKNADIATGVLAGRSASIGRDAAMFVKNARVEK